MGGSISCGSCGCSGGARISRRQPPSVPQPKVDPNPHIKWSGDRDDVGTAVNTGVETDDLQRVSRHGHKDGYGRWCNIVDEFQDGKHTHRYEYECGILKKDWLVTPDGGFRLVWPVPETPAVAPLQAPAASPHVDQPSVVASVEQPAASQ